MDLLYDDSIQDVELQELSVKPYVLYFDDITNNPDDWRNTAVAEYYNKSSVILK